MDRLDATFATLPSKRQIIFFYCVFTQIVCLLVLQGLNVSAPSQIEVVPLFISWKERNHEKRDKNAEWIKIWKEFPKCI